MTKWVSFLLFCNLLISTNNSIAQLAPELKVGVVFTANAIQAKGSATTQFNALKIVWDESYQNSNMTPPPLLLYNGPGVGQVGNTTTYLANIPTTSPSLRDWRDQNAVDLILFIVPDIWDVAPMACGYVLGPVGRKNSIRDVNSLMELYHAPD